MKQTVARPTEILESEDFDVQVIPGYHEEDVFGQVFDPKNSDTEHTLYKFIWQSKTWLYLGYILAYEFYFYLIFYSS